MYSQRFQCRCNQRWRLLLFAGPREIRRCDLDRAPSLLTGKELQIRPREGTILEVSSFRNTSSSTDPDVQH